MKKLGVLGGSFDPIHNGHIYLAKAAYEDLKLDEVLLMPACIAPHKVGWDFAPANDRYRMALLAIEGLPYLKVSDMELKRTGISYTFDTIKQLQLEYPDYEIYFIIGGDTVPELHTWHRIRELLEMVTFVAVGRPGYTDVIERAAEQLGPVVYERVKMLSTEEFSVSSTEIRRRIRERSSLQGLVPEAVQSYIYAHDLYLCNSAAKY